jgi:uncharacterized membrane protein YgdD (TMEM256/DUF423 family)
MERIFALAGIGLAFASVALGAFGAHALQERITPSDAAIFETAVRYQMYHALALLFTAWSGVRWPGGAADAAGWLFVAGTLVFSGSLYLLVLTGTRSWGMITPVGGLALLAGWALLGWAVLRG